MAAIPIWLWPAVHAAHAVMPLKSYPVRGLRWI